MDHYGLRFKQIHNLLDSNFTALLMQYELTAAQFDVLLLLLHEAKHDRQVCQRDIQERLRLKNPTVTGILKRLETKGFITRTQSQSDRRFNYINVTEKTQALDEKLRGSAQAGEDRMLQGFDEDERAALRAYLARIIKNLTAQEDVT